MNPYGHFHWLQLVATEISRSSGTGASNRWLEAIAVMPPPLGCSGSGATAPTTRIGDVAELGSVQHGVRGFGCLKMDGPKIWIKMEDFIGKVMMINGTRGN